MLTVRFSETQGYDINLDAEVIRFMATTGRGTFFADRVIESAKGVRESREKFKEQVIGFMQEGFNAGEIDLDSD